MKILRLVAVQLPVGELSQIAPLEGVMIVERQLDGSPRLVDFICPCGCGTRVRLPICLPVEQRRTPCWKLTIDEYGRPSLEPAVHELDKCRSHYKITNGDVIDCGTISGTTIPVISST